jgi:hypothetical protein
MIDNLDVITCWIHGVLKKNGTEEFLVFLPVLKRIGKRVFQDGNIEDTVEFEVQEIGFLNGFGKQNRGVLAWGDGQRKILKIIFSETRLGHFVLYLLGKIFIFLGVCF